MTEFTSQTAAPTSFLSILDENKKRISEIKQYEEKPVSKLPRNLTFIALTLIALFFIGLFALQIIQGIMALVIYHHYDYRPYCRLSNPKNNGPCVSAKAQKSTIEKDV